MASPETTARSIAPIRDELGVRPGLLLVSGTWREAAGGERLAVVHPSTGEVTTTIACASAVDVDDAVTAATKAQLRWGRSDPRARRRVLQRAAATIAGRAEELNRLQSLDTGMPIAYSGIYQVGAEILADLFEYYAGWCDKAGGETVPLYRGRAFDFTIREPVGVVGAVIPWNAPLVLLGMKLAPALAMGNAVVLKPSEFASLSALRVAEILVEAGVPDGVLSVLTGTGAEAGAALVEHPGVDLVTFTGGRETGADVMRRAAAGVKRVALELGGKSAVMVFPDASDLAAAALNAIGSVAFGLSGQGCACVTRALVHEDCYDAFLDEAVRACADVRHGFAFDPRTNAGPLISETHMDRVLGYIASGLDEGATLACGGGRAGGDGGFFVDATIFTDVDARMRIAREEIFGPVMSVLRFGSTQEAIDLANDSQYGLAGQVWTSDLRTAMQVVRSVRTGTIGVNGYEVVPTAPFGGVRGSGFGREGGREALHTYTCVKNVFLDLG